MKVKERNYGVDALRMVAMFMVVLLHVLGSGGVLEKLQYGSFKYELVWLLEIAAYCAVDCYALISGYVGVKSKYKYTNLGLIWLRVVFYTFGITLIFQIFSIGGLATYDWKKALFPVLFKDYWYVTAYVVLFICMPILNIAINKLGQKQLLVVLVLIFLFSSFLPLFTGIDIMDLKLGYSVGWLMILYMVGGYIRLYEPFKRARTFVWGLLYIGMVFVAWLIKNVTTTKALDAGGNAIISYTSPFIVASSIGLLLLFSRLRVAPRAEKVIGFFAPAAFSVYIIHSFYLISKNVVVGHFVTLADLPAIVLPIAVLGIVVIIYVACSMIDILLRECIFRKLKLKQRLSALECKIIGDTWQ